MPTSSRDRIAAAIKRIAQRGESVTNRGVLDELRAAHGRRASLSTIQPVVAAWHADHPRVPRGDPTPEPARKRKATSQTVDAAIRTLVDNRIAECLAARPDDGARMVEAMRQELGELTRGLQAVVEALARQDGVLQGIDGHLREALGARAGLRYVGNSAPLPRPPAWRPGNTTAARTFGRLVVEAVFDVLMPHSEQAPNRPAMAAEEIIAALPTSLRSQIADRIGRPPDSRYLTRLLQPRVERARYVRCDTSGRYTALPDWRARKTQARRMAVLG